MVLYDCLFYLSRQSFDVSVQGQLQSLSYLCLQVMFFYCFFRFYSIPSSPPAPFHCLGESSRVCREVRHDRRMRVRPLSRRGSTPGAFFSHWTWYRLSTYSSPCSIPLRRAWISDSRLTPWTQSKEIMISNHQSTDDELPSQDSLLVPVDP